MLASTQCAPARCGRAGLGRQGGAHGRVYNFSAGPAVLPEEVLEEAAAEMLDYAGTGMSVMEMSHRSAAFADIIETAEADLRELLSVPDNYRVLFLQGGASQQFAAVPMNLMKNRVADYIVTGSWAKKAFKEAKFYGDARAIASRRGRDVLLHPRLLRPAGVRGCRLRLHLREQHHLRHEVSYASEHQGQGPRGRRVVVLPFRGRWTSRSTASCTAARRRTSARPAWWSPSSAKT